MSSLRRAAQSLVPQLARGFRSSSSAGAGKSSGGELTHAKLAFGDGHHGLRPGFAYDWEHGPHYLHPEKIPNFQAKYKVIMPVTVIVALGIPVFAVWWQQSKLKTG